MKVAIPSKDVKRRIKAEKINIQEMNSSTLVDTIIRFHLEDMLDKLSRGEEIKLPLIGKITPTYRAGVSYLNQKQTEYETIKFGFSPFKELKSKTKTRFTETQKKHL